MASPPAPPDRGVWLRAVALGRDIKEALQMAELVEETAQIAVLGRLLAKA